MYKQWGGDKTWHWRRGMVLPCMCMVTANTSWLFFEFKVWGCLMSVTTVSQLWVWKTQLCSPIVESYRREEEREGLLRYINTSLQFNLHNCRGGTRGSERLSDYNCHTVGKKQRKDLTQGSISKVTGCFSQIPSQILWPCDFRRNSDAKKNLKLQCLAKGNPC